MRPVGEPEESGLARRVSCVVMSDSILRVGLVPPSRTCKTRRGQLFTMLILTVNVLDYPDIREAVKKFSEWPTIPQLYVDGEFIGGCDIITQMHESGELKKVLEDAKAVEG